MGKKSGKKKRRSFADVWGSQSSIGRKYGLSAIAVGKVLIQANLKDPDTKQATQFALGHGYAKSTPLADGRPHFMWNREKVHQLLDIDH